MKPESQRIAIAEACGWKRRAEFDYEEWPTSSLVCRLKMYGKAGELKTADKLPDYLNDLNAMREAQCTLTLAGWRLFIEHLWDCTHEDESEPGDDWDLSAIPLIHATAAQRAEAFLKANGLWKEDENPLPDHPLAKCAENWANDLNKRLWEAKPTEPNKGEDA